MTARCHVHSCRFLIALVSSLPINRSVGLQADEITGNLLNPTQNHNGQSWLLVNGVLVWCDTIAFQMPMGVTLLEDGDILVADTLGESVRRCRGQYCWTIAGGKGRGSGADQFFAPYGTAMSSDGYLFVADAFNNRIQRFHPSETNGITILGSPGGRDDGPGLLKDPMKVFLDEPRRQLYVVDTGHYRVLRFNLTANWDVNNETQEEVAGRKDQLGTNLAYLDNPTSLALNFDTHSLWVTDSRNFRVTSWSSGSTEGTLEITTVGKPYGVYLLHGAVYISDNTDCTVTKYMNGENVTIAGGACGGGNSKLRAPAEIAVRPDGGIIVADSDNNRVAVFSPNPQSQNYRCQLGDICRITLYGGNPIPTNLVAIINGTHGSCGGECLPSGIWGLTWANTAKPEEPYIQDVEYEFGEPTVAGFASTYAVCWGAIADPEAVLTGDCTKLPVKVGELRMLPYVSGNVDQHCALGFQCVVTVIGYALPASSWVISPPAYPDIARSQECGFAPGQSFTGYGDVLMNNPAPTIFHYQPFAADGDSRNLTTILRFDLGVPQSFGTLPLCLCVYGQSCSVPRNFDYDAGTLKVRSTVIGQAFTCWQTRNCTLELRGYSLHEGNQLIVVSAEALCGIVEESIPDVFAITKTSPSYTIDGKVDKLENIAIVELGNSAQQGTFKICYCISVDASGPERVPNGITCDHPAEFLHDVGIISVVRVFPSYHRCERRKPCFAGTHGILLQTTDVLEVVFELNCGEVAPDVGRNSFVANESLGNDTYQEFDAGVYEKTGTHRLCYCATYQSVVGYLSEPPCTLGGDFFQLAGYITVRGVPAGATFRCTAELPCTVTLIGVELSIYDRLQICHVSEGGCGKPDLCDQAGSAANHGLLPPSLVENNEEAEYALGNLSTGIYTICYCVVGTTNDSVCDEPSLLHMDGGSLSVAGVFPPAEPYTCLEGGGCIIDIRGNRLENEDFIMLIELGGKCGVDSGVQDVFYPSVELARTQAMPKLSENTGQEITDIKRFEFTRAASPGIFRICYCALGLERCADASPTAYHLDAGILFVKGLVRSADAVPCYLNKACVVPVDGYGLHASADSINIIDAALGCAGVQIFVDGWPDAGDQNRKYIRASTYFEKKNWYQNEEDGQKIFYDQFCSRWIIGPEVEPNVPDEEGWAWAPAKMTPALDSPMAATPDRVTSAWTVYTGGTPTNEICTTAGVWTNNLNIKVQGSVFVDDPVEHNPMSSANALNLVNDSAAGYPYIEKMDFDVGIISRLGAYRVCYCASEDNDFDGQVCSSESEYTAAAGIVVVHIVKPGRRYHCVKHAICEIHSPLPTSMSFTAVSAELLPIRYRCFEQAADRSLVGISYQTGIPGELGDPSFGFAPATFKTKVTISGSFSVCVCTQLLGSDMSCNNSIEFFQPAGVLYIAPSKTVEINPGEGASLTLTFGKGSMHINDRLGLFGGLGCTGLMLQSAPIQDVSSDGDEGIFVIEPGLLGGVYSACLCADYDGAGDHPPDGISCNLEIEYTAFVAQVFVTAVSSSVVTSSVSSAVRMQIATQPAVVDAGSGRRAAAVPPSSLSRSVSFATLLGNIVQEAFVQALNVDASDCSVSITDLGDFQLTDVDIENGAQESDVINIRAVFRLSLVGYDVQHVAQQCFPMSIEKAQAGGQAIMRSCLTIARLLTCESQCPYTPSDPSLVLLQKVKKDIQSLTVPGVAEIVVLSLESPTAASVGDEPPKFDCIRGLPCNVIVQGSGGLTINDRLLIVDFYETAGADIGLESACGTTAQWNMSDSATSRAVSGFIENPLAPPGASVASRHDFILGSPQKPGLYKLCYCWLGGMGAWALTSCTVNSDFFMKSGQLTVRGAIGDEGMNCAVLSTCKIRLKGVGLSAWDRVSVIDSAASCGSNAKADGVQYNPASSTPLTANDWIDDSSRRTFDLGVINRIGTFLVCYCTAQAGSGVGETEPCTALGDFGMEAGIIAVRGALSQTGRYSCPKSGALAVNPCRHELSGTALLPHVDSVLIADISQPCGTSEPGRLGSDFAPNPVILTPFSTDIVWPPWQDDPRKMHMPEGRWTVDTATVLGDFRLCFCAGIVQDGCVGASCIPCSGPADFGTDLGVLNVRGVESTHVIICQDGSKCGFSLRGVSLSTKDKVKIVGAAEPCNVDLSLSGTLVVKEMNPSSPTEVRSNHTEVSFDLGTMNENTQKVAATLKICYCASYSRNQTFDGRVCADGDDFTHTAGYINTILCPERPISEDLIPDVQDVRGDAGDPFIEVSITPKRYCELRPKGESVTDDSESAQLRQGSNVEVTEISLLSAWPGRCDPAAEIHIPDMNLLRSAVSEVRVGSSAESQDGVLRLADGISIDVIPRARNELGETFTCPSLSFKLLSYGCSSTGALWFCLILHLTYIAPVILTYFVSFWPWLAELLERRTNSTRRLRRLLASCFGECRGRLLEKCGMWDYYGEDGAPRAKSTRSTQIDMLLHQDSVRMVILVVRPALLIINVFILPTKDGAALLITSLFFAFVGILVQLILIYKADGAEGAYEGLGYRPLCLTVAALVKQHLDLLLLVLLRRHHAEVWPMALIFYLCVMMVQVIWPSVLLLSSLAPMRRTLDEATTHFTMESLPAILKKSPLMPSSANMSSPKVGMCAKMHKVFTWPLQALADLCKFIRRLRLQYKLYKSEAAESLPDEKWRYIVAITCASLSASGWHLVTGTVQRKEKPLGLKIQGAQKRCLALCFIFGSLDLAALHALMYWSYWKRLTRSEAWITGLGMLFGILQAAQPGLLTSISELCGEIAFRWKSRTAVCIFALFFRVSASSMISVGCPSFAWELVLCSCSVLVVHPPVVFLFMRLASMRYARLHPKVFETITEHGPPAPMSAELSRFMAMLNEAKRDEDASMSKAKDIYEDIFALAHRIKDTIDGMSHSDTVENRYEITLKIFKLVAAIDKIMCEEGGAANKILCELRRSVNEELEIRRLLFRSVQIAQSPGFKSSSLLSRLSIIGAMFPSGPELYLVHWQSLETLQRVPSPLYMTDGHFVKTARKALEVHGERVVLFATVCASGKNEYDEELSCTNARQMVLFAKWYRKRHRKIWEREVEPYFWIDVSCLPRDTAQWAIYARCIDWEHKPEEESRLSSRTGSKQGVDRGSLSPGNTRQSLASFVSGRATQGTNIDKDDASSAITLGAGSEKITLEGSEKKLLEDATSAAFGDAASGLTEKIIEAFIPMAFAAADGLLVCETPEIDRDAWCRLQIGLAYVLSQACPILYEVDRQLVDIPLKEVYMKKVTKTNNTPCSLTPSRRLVTALTPSARSDGAGSAILNARERSDVPLPVLQDEPTEEEGDDSPVEAQKGTPSRARPRPSPLSSSEGAEQTSSFGVPSPHSVVSFGSFDAYPSPRDTSGRRAFRTYQKCAYNPNAVNSIIVKQGTIFQKSEMLLDRTAKNKTLIEARTQELMSKLPPKERSGNISEVILRKLATEHERAPTPLPRQASKKEMRIAHENAAVQVAVAQVQGDVFKAERVARLSSILYMRPATRMYFDPFPSVGLEFEEELLIAHRLEITVSNVSRSGSDDNESDTSDDSDDTLREIVTLEKSMTHLKADDRILDLYYGKKVVDPTAMSDSSDAASEITRVPSGIKTGVTQLSGGKSGGPVPPLPPVTSMRAALGHRPNLLPTAASPLQCFHPEFHSPNVRLMKGIIVEQFQVAARGARWQRLDLPSGGFVVTDRALKAQLGVLPDSDISKGVCFSVTVESVDPRWGEGLAIGFTAQNPDDWPSSRPLPRAATNLRNTWLCGYGGVWLLDGHQEEATILGNRAAGAWRPRDLEPGDVVTAALGGSSTKTMRVFVNEKLVAEIRCGAGETAELLPEAETTHLWGVLDIVGACLRASLGRASAGQKVALRAFPDGAGRGRTPQIPAGEPPLLHPMSVVHP